MFERHPSFLVFVVLAMMAVGSLVKWLEAVQKNREQWKQFQKQYRDSWTQNPASDVFTQHIASERRPSDSKGTQGSA